jgi:hypothetical protein
MLKNVLGVISLLLFFIIGLFSNYSFSFPFEAGQRCKHSFELVKGGAK